MTLMDKYLEYIREQTLTTLCPQSVPFLWKGIQRPIHAEMCRGRSCSVCWGAEWNEGVEQANMEQSPVSIFTELELLVTNRDIEAIIAMVLEGEIYWCNYAATYGESMSDSIIGHFVNGGWVILFDAEDGADYRLSREMLLDGIKLYIQNPKANDFLEIVDHRLVINTDQIDVEVVDAIIQYALFDQIIFS